MPVWKIVGLKRSDTPKVLGTATGFVIEAIGQ
jgi:hypothetical protein